MILKLKIKVLLLIINIKQSVLRFKIKQNWKRIRKIEALIAEEKTK